LHWQDFSEHRVRSTTPSIELVKAVQQYKASKVQVKDFIKQEEDKPLLENLAKPEAKEGEIVKQAVKSALEYVEHNTIKRITQELNRLNPHRLPAQVSTNPRKPCVNFDLKYKVPQLPSTSSSFLWVLTPSPTETKPVPQDWFQGYLPTPPPTPLNANKPTEDIDIDIVNNKEHAPRQQPRNVIHWLQDIENKLDTFNNVRRIDESLHQEGITKVGKEIEQLCCVLYQET
jgi:hypothetical protein